MGGRTVTKSSFFEREIHHVEARPESVYFQRTTPHASQVPKTVGVRLSTTNFSEIAFSHFGHYGQPGVRNGAAAAMPTQDTAAQMLSSPGP